MDEDITTSVDATLAANAYRKLRAEMSLLRRAIERLTDERTSQPDYAPSIEAIGKGLEDVRRWAQRVSENPALKLTPESLGREISTASNDSRAHDQQLLDRAASTMEAAASRIDAMIARSRSVVDQNRELVRNRIGFAVAGMALFAILPGVVARSLPVSWAVPERIAARMLGRDMWHAGQEMMAKANPHRWDRMVAREHEHALLQKK